MLLNKYFKWVTLNMFKELKETMSRELKESMRLSGQTEIINGIYELLLKNSKKFWIWKVQ